MHRQALGIDVDNVLSETDVEIRRLIQIHTKGRVNYEYEDVVNFDYWRCADRSGNAVTSDEWRTVHREFSRGECIASLPPYRDAQASLKILSSRFDLHLVTSRLPEASEPTREWLRLHDFPPCTLHLVPHRRKHDVNVDFCAIIEVDYDQGMEFASRGVSVYLMKHPWNQDRAPQAGVVWVNGWRDIVKAVLGEP